MFYVSILSILAYTVSSFVFKYKTYYCNTLECVFEMRPVGILYMLSFVRSAEYRSGF